MTHPAQAAHVLGQAFDDVPDGLIEDALARRVEAEGRSGDLAEAGRLAALYLQRFPEGRRASAVRGWHNRAHR